VLPWPPNTVSSAGVPDFANRAALLVWWADGRSDFYRLGSGIDDRVAASLLRTGRFADPYLIPSGPTAHLPPLWPAILALIFTATASPASSSACGRQW